MGYYNSPLIQTKYLIYNMLRHEYELHRIVGQRQQILASGDIGRIVDVTHDHTDPDTMKGSAK